MRSKHLCEKPADERALALVEVSRRTTDLLWAFEDGHRSCMTKAVSLSRSLISTSHARISKSVPGAVFERVAATGRKDGRRASPMKESGLCYVIV